MQEIYLLVGEIIEVSQVIEYNLVLVIKYSEYIKKFKGKGNITHKDFMLFEKEVQKMHNGLLSSTLGQIINKVKEIDIFNSESIEKLFSLLKTRNDLVHKFFKDNNFNEIERFSNKYNQIVASLGAVLKNMQDINAKLCDIINGQQIEFSNLF
ncbi:MAG: hypothetical protein IJZ29_06035 [Clostridia bacterium]|nr:hypothetical protein [Clostridia bacterium]MBQ8750005.1 hypothetical protein [Clostridia bacterium]